MLKLRRGEAGSGRVVRGRAAARVHARQRARALALQSVGARPSGVRRIERVAPELARRLARTLSGLEARECAAALRASIALYVFAPMSRAERPALDYLAEVERRLGLHPR